MQLLERYLTCKWTLFSIKSHGIGIGLCRSRVRTEGRNVFLQNGRVVFWIGVSPLWSKGHSCLRWNAQTRKCWSLSPVTHLGLRVKLNSALFLVTGIFWSSPVLEALDHLYPPEELQQMRSEQYVQITASGLELTPLSVNSKGKA